MVQLSLNFSGSKSFYFSSSFDDELQSSALYSDSYLLTATVSIVLLSIVSFYGELQINNISFSLPPVFQMNMSCVQREMKNETRRLELSF